MLLRVSHLMLLRCMQVDCHKDIHIHIHIYIYIYILWQGYIYIYIYIYISLPQYIYIYIYIYIHIYTGGKDMYVCILAKAAYASILRPEVRAGRL
jgi:hypothetical protein